MQNVFFLRRNRSVNGILPLIHCLYLDISLRDVYLIRSFAIIRSVSAARSVKKGLFFFRLLLLYNYYYITARHTRVPFGNDFTRPAPHNRTPSPHTRVSTDSHGVREKVAAEMISRIVPRINTPGSLLFLLSSIFNHRPVSNAQDGAETRKHGAINGTRKPRSRAAAVVPSGTAGSRFPGAAGVCVTTRAHG